MLSPLAIIIGLAILALLFYAIEVFVTPGIGLAGITATILVFIANGIAYYYYNPLVATLLFIASTIIVLALLWLLGSKKVLGKMALKTSIKSTVAEQSQRSIPLGSRGVAKTRLALIGNADFDGKTVEVKSTEGFIDEGTKIIVTAVRDATIMVKPDLS